MPMMTMAMQASEDGNRTAAETVKTWGTNVAGFLCQDRDKDH